MSIKSSITGSSSITAKINKDDTIKAESLFVSQSLASLNLENVTNESKETMFANPTFTGTPVAPTADSGTNNTQLATTEFVTTAISNNSPNFDDDVTFRKVNITESGSLKDIGLTGTPTAPTASAGTNTTQVATTEFVTTAISNNSPNYEEINVTNLNVSGTASGISKSMVGLGNADNTSDTDKPISTLTQAALDAKISTTSPTLTGTPLAPTADAGTNSTQIATTEFVTTAISNNSPNYEEINVENINVSGTATGISKTMVGLGNVDNTSDTNKPVSTATQTALDLKANLASPTLTGTPVAPTATAGTITTQIATTEFVKTALDDNSPLLKEKIQRIIDENSPGLESDVVFTNLEITGTATGISKSMVGLGNVDNESKSTMFTNAALTGTPTAPTASAATNSTQIATTAYTTTAISNLVDSAPSTLNTLNEIAAALNDSPAQIDNILSAVGQRLVIGNNLSDLNNAGTARTNLGLGSTSTLDVGISENNIAQFTTSVADDDFLKIDGTKVEGRSVSEVKSDLSLGNVTNESKSTMFTNAALTGNPTAPTQSAGNNSTRIATTEFVTTAVSNNSPNYEEINVTDLNVDGTLTIDKGAAQGASPILRVKGNAKFDSPILMKKINIHTPSASSYGGSYLTSNTGITIGYGGMTTSGNYSIAIGSYSANTNVKTSAPGAAQIAIGQGLTAHSGATFGIAIGQYGGLTTTNADRGVAIGTYARVGKYSGIAVGNMALNYGAGSIALGYNTNIHADATDAIAIGTNADTNNANASFAIAIGHDSDANATSGIAIGDNAQNDSTKSIAIGHDTDINSTAFSTVVIGDGASANGSDRSVVIGNGTNSDADDQVLIGNLVKGTVAKVSEIGYWSDTTTRGGAVTIRGATGQISSTIQNRDSAYTDGGATKGSEADNTLMREGYSLRRSSTNLFLDLNVGGTITTKDLGKFASAVMTTDDSPGLESDVTFSALTVTNDASIGGDLSIVDKIVHTGDTNTAIRFPTTDQISIETAGSERVRFDETGKVGIGVTDPTESLDIAGNIHIRGSDADSQAVLQLGQLDSSATTPLYQILTDDTDEDELEIRSGRYGFDLLGTVASEGGTHACFEVLRGTIAGFASSASDSRSTKLSLFDKNDNSGSDVETTVQLMGKAGQTTFFGVDKAATSNGIGMRFGINTGDSIDTGVNFQVKGISKFDSPVDIADHISDGLHVKKTDSGNETVALRLQNDATSTSSVALVFTATTTDTFDNAKISSGRNSSGQASGDLKFFTRENGGSLTQNFTIDPSGHVGIGTTAPFAQLSIPFTSDSEPAIVIPDSTNARYSVGFGSTHVANEGQRLDFYAGDSTSNTSNLQANDRKMVLTRPGRLGIGTDVPTHLLDVDGTANFTGEVTVGGMGISHDSPSGSLLIGKNSGDGSNGKNINIGNLTHLTGTYTSKAISIGYNQNRGAASTSSGAYGNNAIAIGYKTGIHYSSNSVKIGYDLNFNRSSCVAIGHQCNNTSSYGVAVGNKAAAIYGASYGSVAIGGNAYSIAGGVSIGKHAGQGYGDTVRNYKSGASYGSISIGKYSSVVGKFDIAIGYKASTEKKDGSNTTGSVAIGHNVRTREQGLIEIGYWSNRSTRKVGLRLHGIQSHLAESGLMEQPLLLRSGALSDAGNSPSSEAANTLVRGNMAFRRSNTELFIDTNSFSNVQTKSLGELGADLAIADSPTFTSVAKFDKVTFNSDSFITITGNTSITEAQKGAIVLCNNSGDITITVDQQTAGYSATFVAKTANEVAFSAGSGVTLNKISNKNKIEGQFGRATLLYESSTVAYLFGDLTT